MKTQLILDIKQYIGTITEWEWEENYINYSSTEKKKILTLNAILKFCGDWTDKEMMNDRYARETFSFTDNADIKKIIPYLVHLAKIGGIEQVDLSLTEDYDNNLTKIAEAFPASMFINKQLRFTLQEGRFPNLAYCVYDTKMNRILYHFDKGSFSAKN